MRGEQVTFGNVVQKGPVILNFYRGEWCPFCQAQLKALQMAAPEFKALGASLLAISPQTPDHSISTVKNLGLTFDVLSDAGNKVAHEYGIAFTVDERQRGIDRQFGVNLPECNGDESYELPIPATYIIDSDRIIRYSFLDTDYTKRMEPVSILDQIMQVVS